jgi:hypothetical protein
LAARLTIAAMASENPLDTCNEDQDNFLSPSESAISTASAPGDVPSRTASPSTSTASLPYLPVSELVSEFDTVLQPPPSSSLHDSKHNPDFRVRNYAKFTKIAAIMLEFNTLLQAARRSEDQSAVDCLHAQMLKAGEDLDSLAQSPLVARANEDLRFRDEGLGLGRIVPPNIKNEWYMVQHDAPEGDVTECDASATRKLQCARKIYEAALDDETSSDSESDGGAPVFEEQQNDDEDTTLVEDSPEEFELLHAASSLTLDGSQAQAAPDSMEMDYPEFYRPEVLHRAADFLEKIQSCNATTLKTYGITLEDLDIEEDEISMSEGVENFRFEPVQPIIEAVETLRCNNEVVMAVYGISVDDLDVELDESEEIMEE